jgi:hypothetical protein
MVMVLIVRISGDDGEYRLETEESEGGKIVFFPHHC